MTQNRQPAGVPTGGQFAAAARAEATTLRLDPPAPNAHYATPATREEINAILAPGSRWRQTHFDRHGDPDFSGQVVTIQSHSENYINVAYATSTGGPYVKDMTFGVDGEGRPYLYRDNQPVLVYVPEAS